MCIQSQEQDSAPDVYAGELVTRALEGGPEHCQRPNTSVKAAVVQGAAGSLGLPHCPSSAARRGGRSLDSQLIH